jgi:NAD+ synthase (glutamine-hydrolysing)
MKITIAQLDPIVGDIEGNLGKVIDTLKLIRQKNSDLIIFSELFLTGYPPRDLLEKSWFVDKTKAAIKSLMIISKKYQNTGIILGVPYSTNKKTGRGLYNSALLIYQGNIVFRQDKSLLPTYDVFDEARYFDVAENIDVVPFKNEILGISICEDAWNDEQLWPKRYYPFDPQQILSNKGATVFINISASPFHRGKEEARFRIFQNHVKKHKIPFIFVNQIGGNDELIFDGRSICIDKKGNPIYILPSFKEKIETIDIDQPGKPNLFKPQNITESIYEALILGIRDYINKCGFSKIVVGLSGGIDSAVVCCLAKEALGSENVIAVTMPGPFSSEHSVIDSQLIAGNLGITLKQISINEIYNSYIKILNNHLEIQDKIEITNENIQARIRGNILMAFSNKYNYLVLSTGNKSELAIGYCTLYGDMSGGLAVISDLPKTMVYKLASFINRYKEIIPIDTIKKPPSAELRPNQKDQDTLPPYDLIDQILYYYIDEGYSPNKIIKMDFDPNIVKWIIKAVEKNEYKRRQAPPGLKVSPKAFGIGRRMPIATKYNFWNEEQEI